MDLVRAQRIHVTTACRWWQEGTLPVPAREADRLILVPPDTAAGPSGPDATGLCARVSSRDQVSGLGRQVARLSSRAGLPVVRAGAGIRFEMDGAGAKACGLLVGPGVTVVAGDRPGWVSAGLAGAALAVHGRRLVVVDDGGVTGDMVRDMIGVLTSLCARLYGRRPAGNRALRVTDCARRGPGPRAAAGPG